MAAWRALPRGLALVAGAAVWASCDCAPETASAGEARAAAPPQRIVSLDYCADQYVLKLVEPERILAVSPDAVKPFSYMRKAAAGAPTVRPRAEDVLILRPDLVVRAYGGGPNAAAVFARAGTPVLQVGWAATLDGDDPSAIPHVIQHVADGLGVSERGAALVAAYRARLAARAPPAERPSALYMTPGGVTTGPGSLVHEMLTAAGLGNFQRARGWRPLPLERLAYEQPDVAAAATFSAGGFTTPDPWTAARHPLAQRQLRERVVVPLDGAWTACGAWFVMDAVEALAEGASAAAPETAPETAPEIAPETVW